MYGALLRLNSAGGVLSRSKRISALVSANIFRIVSGFFRNRDFSSRDYEEFEVCFIGVDETELRDDSAPFESIARNSASPDS